MLSNHNKYIGAASDRRKSLLEKSFAARTQLTVAFILTLFVAFMKMESNMVQPYVPDMNTLEFPVLRPVYDPKLNLQDQARFRSDEILFRLTEVSSMDQLEQYNTPQNKAFLWIVNIDALQLSVDDKHLFQRYVLALLWFSTTSDEHPWRHEEILWLSERHECNWNRKNQFGNLGVLECTKELQVKSLLLAENNLHGSLPSELSQLSKLVYLDLQNNALTGELPSELGNLINLDYLGLSSNQLQGTIPRSLGRLRSVGEFCMDMLSMNWHSLFSHTETLVEQMLFHDNRLTGQLPASICRLFNIGILINLWSDCLNGDSLTCECCTVCCSAPGKCGPTGNMGMNQEYGDPSILSGQDNKDRTGTEIASNPVEDENVPIQRTITGDTRQVTDISVVEQTNVEIIQQTNPAEEKSTVVVTEQGDLGSSQSLLKLQHEQDNAESINAVEPLVASGAEQSLVLLLEANQTTGSGGAIAIESIQNQGNDTIAVQI